MSRRHAAAIWVVLVVLSDVCGRIPVQAQVSVPTPRAVVPSPLVRSAAERADSFVLTMEPGQAMVVLRARLDVAPNDFDARWRACQVGLFLGVLAEDHDDMMGWLRLAEDNGERALALRPDAVEALAWTAATKGRLAIEDKGARATVRLANEVWDLTARLLAEDPGHPLGNDIRGKLHQEVLRLSGFQRFVARLLGSDLIGRVDWITAERHFARAMETDPTILVVYLDLGESYRVQGKVLQAMETFRKGLDVPDRYPVDRKYRREIRRQLDELEAEAAKGTGR